MREYVRQLISSARRDSWTNPADSLNATDHINAPATVAAPRSSSPSSSPLAPSQAACTIGEHALRLAHTATAIHLDQAASLRAMMAADRRWHDAGARNAVTSVLEAAP